MQHPIKRPDLPALKRGDRLVLRGTTPGRRYSMTESTDVRVVGIGPKYVHVITAHRYDQYEAKRDKWITRKFLLADLQEGDRASRYGYPASVATPEQHAYDLAGSEARDYLQARGISLAHDSVWRGREAYLASVIKAAAVDG
jgi:hypothetical protein